MGYVSLPEGKFRKVGNSWVESPPSSRWAFLVVRPSDLVCQGDQTPSSRGRPWPTIIFFFSCFFFFFVGFF